MAREHTPAERTAIAKMMAARRAQLRYESASFPKFEPGMTTEAYLRLFNITRPHMLQYGPKVYHPTHGYVLDLSRWARPAPMLDGPEVIDESET